MSEHEEKLKQDKRLLVQRTADADAEGRCQADRRTYPRSVWVS
jgi:hypothetical protein